MKEVRHPSLEQNLALARKYFGELHSDKFAATADEIFDTNLALKGPAYPTKSTRGREGYKTIMGRYQGAFPDWKNTVEDWIIKQKLRWESGSKGGDVHARRH